MFEIFFSWMRMYGVLEARPPSARCRSRSTARGSRGRTACPRRRRARSRALFASSTVMTPSLPTFFIASAIILPISVSPFARIVPTCAMSFLPLVGFESFFSSLDDGLDGLVDAALELHRVVAGGDELGALAVDRLREHGRGGGAVAGDVGGLRGDLLHHLRAHVLELVLELDLLRDGDAVLGDRGRAEDFSMTTLRPFGPRVTFTASARVLTPREDARCGRCSSKMISLAAMFVVSLVRWARASASR